MNGLDLIIDRGDGYSCTMNCSSRSGKPCSDCIENMPKSSVDSNIEQSEFIAIRDEDLPERLMDVAHFLAQRGHTNAIYCVRAAEEIKRLRGLTADSEHDRIV